MTSENPPSPEDSTPPPPPSDGAFELPTWEDDENGATAVLRALFTVLAAGFLGYAQWNAPVNWPGAIGQNWGRWVWTSVVCNFGLPLGIVWMFFGQGLTYQDWLKDQRHNAWNYGWNWKHLKRHAIIALVCWAVFLPFMIYASSDPDMRAAYINNYLPTVASPKDWVFLLGTLVIYMFCWEWFFRGFMLFGTAQGFGVVVAIILQAIAFGMAHTGKPIHEMQSAYAGGVLLGILAWREKSFVPAFLIHALIHITWVILILR